MLPILDPNTVQLENELSDAIGCRVTIALDRVEIHYHRDLDILDGILWRLRGQGGGSVTTNDDFWV